MKDDNGRKIPPSEHCEHCQHQKRYHFGACQIMGCSCEHFVAWIKVDRVKLPKQRQREHLFRLDELV